MDVPSCLTAGWSTSGRHASSRLLALLLSLLHFFSCPALLLASFLLSSVSLSPVLPVPSCLPCGVCMGLSYLLFVLRYVFHCGSEHGIFLQLPGSLEASGFLDHTVEKFGFGLLFFCLFVLMCFFMLTQSLTLKLNSHTLDVFCFMPRLKPSSITAVPNPPELVPTCCTRADLEEHPLLTFLRLRLGGWHHLLHSEILSLHFVPWCFDPIHE